jgi:hypothetical protein
MPILTGKQKEVDRTFFWRTSQRSKHKAMRDGHWKYLQDEKGEYLFDLSTDQQEKNNLRTREGNRFKKMKEQFGNWEKTVLQPIPL